MTGWDRKGISNDKRYKIAKRFNLSYSERADIWGFESESFNCDCCYSTDFGTPSEVYEIRPNQRRSRLRVCEPCLEANSRDCPSCGFVFLNEYIAEDEEKGESYCSTCLSLIISERDEAGESGGIPDYKKGRRAYPKDRALPSYSIELEIECRNRWDFAQALDMLHYKAQGYSIGYERDESLDDDEGIEVLISCLPTLPALGEVLDSVVGLASKWGSKSWDTDRCGAHINSNRSKEWTPSRIARLLFMCRENFEVLSKIAGRKSTLASLPLDLERKPLLLREWAFGNCKKYSALRVQPERIEWRIFKGTLNPLRLSLYLKTVETLEVLALSNIPSNKLKKEASARLWAVWMEFVVRKDEGAQSKTVSECLKAFNL